MLHYILFNLQSLATILENCLLVSGWTRCCDRFLNDFFCLSYLKVIHVLVEMKALKTYVELL